LVDDASAKRKEQVGLARDALEVIQQGFTYSAIAFVAFVPMR